MAQSIKLLPSDLLANLLLMDFAYSCVTRVWYNIIFLARYFYSYWIGYTKLDNFVKFG